jgi:hypothetical protein
MYTGTLIEDLMAAVERVEKNAYLQVAELERWYTGAPYEMKTVEANLVGVA